MGSKQSGAKTPENVHCHATVFRQLKEKSSKLGDVQKRVMKELLPPTPPRARRGSPYKRAEGGENPPRGSPTPRARPAPGGRTAPWGPVSPGAPEGIGDVLLNVGIAVWLRKGLVIIAE